MKEPSFNITERIEKFENGELSEKDTIEFFQYLYDSGMIYILQGTYQRYMKNFVDAGLVKLPADDARISATSLSLDREAAVETARIQVDDTDETGVSVLTTQTESVEPLTGSVINGKARDSFTNDEIEMLKLGISWLIEDGAILDFICDEEKKLLEKLSKINTPAKMHVDNDKSYFQDQNAVLIIVNALEEIPIVVEAGCALVNVFPDKIVVQKIKGCNK